MNSIFIIATAGLSYLAMCVGWVLLTHSQWNLWVTAITSMPLVLMLLLMIRQRPIVYFYAALLSMPYLATAITQIMISRLGREGAILCLAAGLIYLALLALVLRTLNRRT